MKEIKSEAMHLFCSVILYTLHNKFLKGSYHLNYESGVYRRKDLVKIIRYTVIYFALSQQELPLTDSLARLQKKAWNCVSNCPRTKSVTHIMLGR